MNSSVASEALKRVIMRNFARRNIRSISAVVANCTEQKGEEGDIYFLIKTSSKKKKRTRAPGGQSSGGQKKRRIYERSRRKKRRETTEDEIKTIANGAIYHRHSRVSSFFLSISLFSSPPRGKVGEGKKRERSF